MTLVAYFSMEIALASELPTYAGGLGILAGDLLRSAADLRQPFVGVTLLYRSGYLRQRLDADGAQREDPIVLSPDGRLVEAPARVTVSIAGRAVTVRAFVHEIVGHGRARVPVYLLDTELPENDPRDRALTGRLYGGDQAYRLAQEIVLGVGGARLLGALGLSPTTLHLNEGHTALAAWAWQRDHGEDLAAIRRRCAFTTHTPVVAGHDHFPRGLVEAQLGAEATASLCGPAPELDTTRLGLRLSGHANAVSTRHAEIARLLFPEHDLSAITNGVHPRTWACPAVAALLDRQAPGWIEDPSRLRQALCLSDDELWAAHRVAKAALLDEVARRTGVRLGPEPLTIGVARRVSGYKRTDLVLSDLERLRRIGAGRLQLLFAGKAHPGDAEGQALIRRVSERARALGPAVPALFVPDYDLELAQRMVAGVDLWLNTPMPPMEASGTSGMKAAWNGVPSLSVLDGWWCEGHVAGLTGWAADDAAQLYARLEAEVLPAYADRAAWASIMKHTLAINAAHFTSHRALTEYLARYPR